MNRGRDFIGMFAQWSRQLNARNLINSSHHYFCLSSTNIHCRNWPFDSDARCVCLVCGSGPSQSVSCLHPGARASCEYFCFDLRFVLHHTATSSTTLGSSCDPHISSAPLKPSCHGSVLRSALQRPGPQLSYCALIEKQLHAHSPNRKHCPIL